MTINGNFERALHIGLRTSVDSSRDPMFVVQSGRLVHANGAGLTLLRATNADVLGRTFEELLPDESREREVSRLRATAEEGCAEMRSSLAQRADGSHVRVDTSMFAHFWEGKPATLVRMADRGTLRASAEETRHRILVVDDEAVIGVLVKRILRDHDVVHVTSAPQAVDLLSREPFDAILCDVMMPGMSGVDLYEIVRRDQPLLQKRFVFVTGGAFTKRARDFLATIPNPRIDKPFEASAIRAAISSLLS